MKKEHSEYLTELSNKGVVNIDAATPYLKYKFELTEEEAQKIISEWLNSKLLNEGKGCGCGL